MTISGFQEANANTVDPFVTGDLAMVVNANNLAMTIAKYNPELNWGVALIPTSDGENYHTSWSGGMNLEFTDHGEDRLNAAIDFGLWLTSAETQKDWMTIDTIWSGNNQARLTCQDAYASLNLPEQYWNVLEQTAPITRMEETCPEYMGWRINVINNINEMFAGNLTPAEALTNAETEINHEIDNYLALNYFPWH
jgi:ABC-type glycerol-3-phosphate transport system substrate-binding protein